MGDVAQFTIWGLGGAVAVSLIMELLKRVFVDAEGKPVIKDRWAVLAAVGVGMVLSGLSAWGEIVPVVKTVLDVVGAGLLAGLSATGIFSLTKKRKGNN